MATYILSYAMTEPGPPKKTERNPNYGYGYIDDEGEGLL